MTRSLILAGLATSMFGPTAVARPTLTADQGGQAAYEALRDWRLADAASSMRGLRAGSTLTAAKGVLANRKGRPAEAIALLAPLVPRISSLPPRWAAMTLVTLSDSYRKLSRFADELPVDQLALNDYTEQLGAGRRADLEESLDTARILKGVRATTVVRTGPVRLPMTREPVGIWSVRLGEGEGVTPWVLDTGANYSVVTDATARRLSLKVLAGATTTGTSTERRIDVRYAIVPQLRLGGATLRDLVVLVVPEAVLHVRAPGIDYQMDAVLGLNAFVALGQVAFERSEWFSSDPSDEPGSGALLMDGLMPVIEASVGGDALPFGLDTGANRTILFPAYARRVSASSTSWERSRKSTIGAGGASTYSGRIQPRVAFSLAGRPVVMSDVEVRDAGTSPDENPLYGNIGADLVGRYDRFALDFWKMSFDARPTATAHIER